MTDQVLSDKTEATTLPATAIMYAVLDPTGSPLDRKVSVATLAEAVATESFDDPMDTEGDVIYRDATGVAKLARGTEAQVLTSTADTIEWATPVSGFADPLTNQGDLITRDDSATVRLPLGTAGQVLTSDGTDLIWGSVDSSVFNVVDYGADPTGATECSTEIQACIDACGATGVVYFPVGQFKIDTTLDFSFGNFFIQGAGYGVSSLYTETNIPMIRINTNGVQAYFSFIKNMTFIGNVSGTRTSNSGILFYGTNTTGYDYVNYCRFSNLLFMGVYHGIYVNRAMAVGTTFPEACFNFNVFTKITCCNYSSYNTQYGLLFKNGSGTGNVFSTSTLITMVSGIEWDSATANIGDIVVSNIQFGGGGTAIKGDSAAPYSNGVQITNCRFDAGIDVGINLQNYTNLKLLGNDGPNTDTAYNLTGSYYVMDSDPDDRAKNPGIYSQGFLTGARLAAGTSDPDTLLDIRGPSAAQNTLGQAVIGSTDTAGIDKGGQLGFGMYYNGTADWSVLANISGRKENATANNYASYLAFATTVNAGVITERMRITSNGYVGIGKTDPATALDVNGTITATTLTGTLTGLDAEILNVAGTQSGITTMSALTTISQTFAIGTNGGGDRAQTIYSGTTDQYLQFGTVAGSDGYYLAVGFPMSIGTSTAHAVNFYTGNTTRMSIAAGGAVNVVGALTAASYTDNTPGYDGDALAELKLVKTVDGKIDHSSLPVFTQSSREEDVFEDAAPVKSGKKKGKPIKVGTKTIPTRDLGATISVLVKAVQQLTDRLEKAGI